MKSCQRCDNGCVQASSISESHSFMPAKSTYGLPQCCKRTQYNGCLSYLDRREAERDSVKGPVLNCRCGWETILRDLQSLRIRLPLDWLQLLGASRFFCQQHQNRTYLQVWPCECAERDYGSDSCPGGSRMIPTLPSLRLFLGLSARRQR